MKKRDKRIFVSGPSITDREIELVAEATRTAWYDGAYRFINQFQDEMASMANQKYGVATSSCTGALHMVLDAVGIGPGDEVIMGDIGWVSTAAVVKYLGGTPIYVDVEPDTWCIDPSAFEAAITERTKAVIPVHIYGHPADMDRIMEIAKRHDLFVLEDCAESVGSTYDGKATGSFGDVGCWSFQGAKLISTGEGGMITTSDDALLEKIQLLHSQGKDPDKLFFNLVLGYKYRMSDLQAAFGIGQLSHLEEIVDKKRLIFSRYRDRLAHLPGLTLNAEREGCKNTFWMVNLIPDASFGISKEDFGKRLQEYNIDSRPMFYPLSSLPPLKTEVNNPISYDLSARGINLPCGYKTTEEEVDYVCAAVREILRVS